MERIAGKIHPQQAENSLWRIAMRWKVVKFGT